jgi:hypothetical protein
MKKIYLEFRNVMHVVGFFTLAYWGLSKLEIHFYLWQKILLAFVLSAIGYAVGHGYEGLRKILFGDPVSNSDGNLSWLGFTLGVITVLINNDITFISTYLFYICLTMFIIDFILAIKRKNKKP